MTPLAAQLFRHGDDQIRTILAQCQFMEISAIVNMAQEMGQADVEAGCDEYSEFAQLPDPLTVIEFNAFGSRCFFICEQREEEIRYSAFYSIPGSDAPADFRFSTGFRLGTSYNTGITWANFEGEKGFDQPNRTMTEDDIRHKTARGMSLLIEKALCILNQPGLVDRQSRATDKRVFRVATPSVPPAHWYECKVRSGIHGSGKAETVADESIRALHYVRKHFKPSLRKWIEGYWRGDVTLGIHLKWYSPRPPS